MHITVTRIIELDNGRSHEERVREYFPERKPGTGAIGQLRDLAEQKVIIAHGGVALVPKTLSQLAQERAAALFARLPAIPEQSPTCTLAKGDWYCTREPGHDGPCAAVRKQ